MWNTWLITTCILRPPPASTATPRQDQVPNTSPTTARFIPTATMNAQAALNVDLTFPIRRNSSSSASSIRLHSLKSLRSLQPINPNWRFSHLANFISNSIFLPSSGVVTLSLISLMLGWTLALSWADALSLSLPRFEAVTLVFVHKLHYFHHIHHPLIHVYLIDIFVLVVPCT